MNPVMLDALECHQNACRCTVLTDLEYDQRIAFGMAERVLDDFTEQYPVEVV